MKLPDNSKRTDAEIARAAVTALEWDVLVPENLQVSVEDGWVTLNGKVDLKVQTHTAQHAVEHLRGVKGVINNLTIKSQVAPSAVKERIAAALQRQAAVDAQGIQVTTDNGTVTLEGTVHSWSERVEAENAAWSTPDVHTVIDKLTVES